MDDPALRARALALAVPVVLGGSIVGGCALEAAAREEAIFAGEPSGDEAVVALVPRRVLCDETGEALCSGTLIGPRTVLTAAHCLDDVRFAGELEVFFGPSLAEGGTFVMVSGLRVDPDYDPLAREHDIAVLALAEDAPVAPVSLSAVPLEVLAPGAELRAVGYGSSGLLERDGGVRRSGTMTLGEVRAGSFDATPSPGLSCHGDSGGPVLAMVEGREVIVGVTAFGDSACRETATQMRLDAVFESFVRPAQGELEALGPAWPEGAIALDDVGTASCEGDAACPALMQCGTNGAGEPRCVLPGWSAASLGEACTGAASCGAGDCLRIWPGGPDACRCASADVPLPPAMVASTGCSAGGRRRGAFAPLALALAAWAWVRRRS